MSEAQAVELRCAFFAVLIGAALLFMFSRSDARLDRLEADHALHHPDCKALEQQK